MTPESEKWEKSLLEQFQVKIDKLHKTGVEVTLSQYGKNCNFFLGIQPAESVYFLKCASNIYL